MASRNSRPEPAHPPFPFGRVHLQGLGRLGGLGIPLVVVAAGCDLSSSPFEGGGGDVPFGLECSIPAADLRDGGVGVDGIPSLQNPDFEPVENADPELLPDTMRVVGVELDGRALAVPHNIMWYHEIVNLDLPSGESVAITYCPLTGSPLAFDRSDIDGAELGVSGLLYRNNLVMYDRSEDRSLWPQMDRAARCGPRDGAELSMLPVIDMEWRGWRQLYPDGEFVGFETGRQPPGASYRQYPYGDYESLDSQQTLFPQENRDGRRVMKERVLAIPPRGPEGALGGVAFPFLELAEGDGRMEVVHAEFEGEEVVVFWEGESEAARAYRPEVDGEALSFETDGNRIVDEGTGSRWRVDGRASDGELEGRRLEPLARAYVAFWFAWTDFHPETEIWERDG